MAVVSLPYTLTAGQPENVNNLNSNLTALLTGVNNIDSANITDGSIALADLSTAVTDLLVPVGSLLDYSGSSDPVAAKWLLADGRALSRSTYATLFGILSTTYGVGDGSTTFNIPDLRGRTAVGPDNMGTAQGAASRMADSNTRGAGAGSSTRTLAEANVPGHTHTVSGTAASGGAHTHTGSGTTSTTGAHTHSYTWYQLDFVGTASSGSLERWYSQSNPTNTTSSNGNHSHTYSFTTSSDGAHTHSVSGSTGTGSGTATAFDNRQPYQVINKIIRVA